MYPQTMFRKCHKCVSPISSLIKSTAKSKPRKPEEVPTRAQSQSPANPRRYRLEHKVKVPQTRGGTDSSIRMRNSWCRMKNRFKVVILIFKVNFSNDNSCYQWHNYLALNNMYEWIAIENYNNNDLQCNSLDFQWQFLYTRLDRHAINTIGVSKFEYVVRKHRVDVNTLL